MSLLQIAKVPTAENSAIHLNSADNIAVARVPLAPGNEIRVDGSALTIQDAVPAGHKVALSPIRVGENIVRYGQVIGRARIAIEPGQHVHTQNVEFGELTFDYEFPVGERAIESTSKKCTDVPWVCSRGRTGGHTELYCCSRSQQLRGPHSRADRGELRSERTASWGSWRSRVPSWRGLRTHDRTRHRSTAPHSGRRPGSSECRGSGDPRFGLRG